MAATCAHTGYKTDAGEGLWRAPQRRRGGGSGRTLEESAAGAASPAHSGRMTEDTFSRGMWARRARYAAGQI